MDVSASIKLIDEFSEPIKKIIDSTKKAESVITQMANKLNSLSSNNLNQIVNSSKQAQTATQKVAQGIGNISNKTNSLNAGKITSMSSASSKLATSSGNASNKMNQLGSAEKGLSSSKITQLKSAVDSTSGSVEKLSSAFSGLAGKITAAVTAYAGIETIGKGIQLTDQMTSIGSRLGLINDGLQTQEQLQSKIFEAANKSRASYADTANLVASLGNNARDAFSSTAEIVDFAELVNKTFVMSGASSDEMSNALVQLTQGLASGTLRGDELNSVLEQAPELAGLIAKKMGITRGQIKDYAEEGKITADVVKSAVLDSADEINNKFGKMQTTFGQAWTVFKNKATQAFQPVMAEFSKLADNPAVTNAIDRIGNLLTSLAPKFVTLAQSISNIAPKVLDALVSGLEFLVNHGSAIVGTLGAITAGFIALKAAMVFKGAVGILKSIEGAGVAAKVLGAGTAEASVGVKALAIAIALLSNPITAVITAIAALAGSAAILTALGVPVDSVKKKFEQFGTSVNKAGSKIKKSLTDIGKAIFKGGADFGTKTGEMMGAIANGIVQGATSITQATEKVLGGIESFVVLAGRGICDGIKNMMSQFVTTIRDTLPQAATEFGNGLGNMVGKVAELIPFILSTATNIVTTFVTGIAQALPTLVTSGINFVQGFISGIMQKVPDVAGSFLACITGIIRTIAENIPTLIQSGIQTVANFVVGIFQAIPQIADSASEMIRNFQQTLETWIPGLIQAGGDLINSIGQGIVQSWPIIQQAGIDIWNALVQFFTVSGPQLLQTGWDFIVFLAQGIGSGITMLIQNLGIIWNNITAWFQQNWPTIQQKGLEFLTWLGQGIVMGAQQIGTFLAQVWTNISTWFSQHWQDIINQGINFLSWLGQGIISGLSLLGQFLGQLWTSITTWFSENWPTIQQKGYELLDWICQGIETGLPLLAAGFMDLLGKIGGWIIEYGPTLLEKAGELILNIGQAIITNLPTILGFLGDLLLKLAAALIAFVPTLLGAALKLIGAIATGIVNATGTILGKLGGLLKSIVDKIGEWIGKVKDKAIEIGKNIINGIVEGVKNWWDNVTSTIGDLCNGALDAAKNVLGINSPSKEFAKIGRYVMQGFQEGIRDNSQLVENELSRISANLSGSIDPNTSLTGSQSLGTSLVKGVNSANQNVRTSINGLQNTFVNSVSGLESYTSDLFYNVGFTMTDSLTRGMNDGMNASVPETQDLVSPIQFMIEGDKKSQRKSMFDFSTGFDQFVPNLQKSSAGPLAGLVNTFMQAYNEIIQIIKALYDRSKEYFIEIQLCASDNAWESVDQSAAKIRIATEKELIPALQQMRDSVLSISGELQNALTQAFSISGNVEGGEGAFSSLIQSVQSARDQILQTLGELDTSGKEKVSNLVNSIKSTSEEFIQTQFPNYFQSANTKIFGILDQLKAQAGQKVGEAAQAMCNALQSGIQKAIKLATQLQTQVPVIIEDMASKVQGTILDLVRWASVNGENFVSGFINGMKSKEEELRKAAISLASTAKTGMKNELEINSPSKVAQYYGEMFGEGFRQGLIDPNVLYALRTSGNKIVNEVTGTLNGLKRNSINVESSINLGSGSTKQLNQLTSQVQQTQQQIKQSWNQVLSEAVPIVQQYCDQAATKIGNLYREILWLHHNMCQTSKGWWENFITRVLPVTQQYADRVVTSFKNMYQQVSGIVQNMASTSENVQAGINLGSGNAEQTSQSIIQSWNQVVSGALPIVQQYCDEVYQKIERLFASIMSFHKCICLQIEGWWENVIKYALPVTQEYVDRAIALFKNMGQQVPAIVEGTASKVQNTILNLGNWAGSNGENFVNGFINGMTSKEEDLRKAAISLANTAKTGMKDELQNNLPSQFANILNNQQLSSPQTQHDTIVNWWKKTEEDARPLYFGYTLDVVNYLGWLNWMIERKSQQAHDTIINGWGQLNNDAIPLANQYFNKIATSMGVDPASNFINRYEKNDPSDVISKSSALSLDATQAMETGVTESYENMGVSSAVQSQAIQKNTTKLFQQTRNNAVYIATNMRNNVYYQFRLMANSALSFGKNIAIGLANGMYSTSGYVIQAANYLVGSVQSIFQSGLRIHSPSKLTDYYGRMVGKGFANGLKNSEMISKTKSILGTIKGIFTRNKPNIAVSESKIPSYAVGTKKVPEDMLAQIHKGEAIIPASQNPFTSDQARANPMSLDSMNNRSTTTTNNIQTPINVNVTYNVTENNDIDYSFEDIKRQLVQALRSGIRNAPMGRYS